MSDLDIDKTLDAMTVADLRELIREPSRLETQNTKKLESFEVDLNALLRRLHDVAPGPEREQLETIACELLVIVLEQYPAPAILGAIVDSGD